MQRIRRAKLSSRSTRRWMAYHTSGLTRKQTTFDIQGKHWYRDFFGFAARSANSVAVVYQNLLAFGSNLAPMSMFDDTAISGENFGSKKDFL